MRIDLTPTEAGCLRVAITERADRMAENARKADLAGNYVARDMWTDTHGYLIDVLNKINSARRTPEGLEQD